MREIVLDTETTGLDPLAGHRVVEVGCIELLNTVATGRTFHAYFNPEMIMPMGAQDIHGLSDEFLADKPLFAERVEEFLAFIADAQLVIHNAQFDIGFLNAELERVKQPKLTNPYIDTVSMARRKFPGQRASLDALCERFGIDNSSRTKHGALLDSELLAEVYLELSGGRQRDLGLVMVDHDDVERARKSANADDYAAAIFGDGNVVGSTGKGNLTQDFTGLRVNHIERALGFTADVHAGAVRRKIDPMWQFNAADDLHNFVGRGVDDVHGVGGAVGDIDARGDLRQTTR